MCFSCRWDVPAWHTSKTCPAECRKPGHCEEVDRNNARAYKDTGYDVRMKGAGKTQLLINPSERQAWLVGVTEGLDSILIVSNVSVDAYPKLTPTPIGTAQFPDSKPKNYYALLSESPDDDGVKVVMFNWTEKRSWNMTHEKPKITTPKWIGWIFPRMYAQRWGIEAITNLWQLQI